MINQGLKMLKRAIDERPKGGMQTGMPKIQLREADAVRAVAELEWAQKRITELAATVAYLREQLSFMAAQHQCGCGHPACNRCRDDADNQEVLRETQRQLREQGDE